jgi:hypothetical protein
MATDQYLTHVEKKIQADIDRLCEIITDGSCKTIEEYRRMTGEITGLRTAMLHVADLNKRLDEA